MLVENAKDDILEELPYVRRFARALIGNQSVADALIVVVLQRVTNDPNLLYAASSLRHSLYKVFIEVYNSPTGQDTVDDGFLSSKLVYTSPPLRQAFLLTTVEQLSDFDAAEVMGLDIETFNDLKVTAQTEVAAQMSSRVFIIEDEIFIANDIEHCVSEAGHVVVGHARTQTEALTKLKDTPVDIILSDIHLADGSSGVRTVDKLLGINDDLSVIFITGYPERLLSGLKPEPTFLIEKPFSKPQVSALLNQVVFLQQSSKRAQDAAQLQVAV